MPNAKHKVTGIVVELSEKQLENPVYAELFDVVDEDARCLPCALPPATDFVDYDETEEEEWQE